MLKKKKKKNLNKIKDTNKSFDPADTFTVNHSTWMSSKNHSKTFMVFAVVIWELVEPTWLTSNNENSKLRITILVIDGDDTKSAAMNMYSCNMLEKKV